MTIEELYQFAKTKKAENYQVNLQYQDDGGIYEGSTQMSTLEVNDIEEEIILS